MYFCLCISFPIPLTKIWNLSRRNLGLLVLMRIEHREATQGISKWYRSEKELAWLVRPGKRLLTLLDVQCGSRKLIGCVDLACCLSQLLKMHDARHNPTATCSGIVSGVQ